MLTPICHQKHVTQRDCEHRFESKLNQKESNRSRKTAGAAVAGSGGGVQMNSNNYITVLIILVILLACSIGITI